MRARCASARCGVLLLGVVVDGQRGRDGGAHLFLVHIIDAPAGHAVGTLLCDWMAPAMGDAGGRSQATHLGSHRTGHLRQPVVKPSTERTYGGPSAAPRCGRRGGLPVCDPPARFPWMNKKW